jgi:hypothetical protein
MSANDDNNTPKPHAGEYNRASTDTLRRLGKGHHLSHDDSQAFLAFVGNQFCAFLNDQQVGELMLAWQHFDREGKAAEEIQASEGELAAGDDADDLTERLIKAAAEHLASR